ncbi:MAG: hypothetical protein EKK42_34510 [Pseudonocardiaceae bacterium]|nr:MAG: hypothetical protein EKK42_34510 [Pseudonocardiaceae bacterium]
MTSPEAPTAGRGWRVERDVDAVEALLWPWITAAGDVEIPLLGTPAWTAADPTGQLAGVAVFVLGCLVERDPLVIAARLAAEIATVRTVRCTAARQASHAIAAGAEWSAVAGRLLQRDRATETTRAGA